MKRQLTASPFASPVLKQPCTKRLDHDDEDGDQDGSVSLEGSDSEELAQPLRLADLQTETYDFTNVTSTGCTAYFSNFGLEEPQGHHPLHSTAYKWLPTSHSTAVTSQGAPSANWLSLPGASQTNLACVDSGVAASSVFNGTTGASTNDLGATKSSGNLQQSLQSSGKEDDPTGEDSDACTSDIRDVHLTARPQYGQQVAHTKRRQPNLPTINEDEAPCPAEAEERIFSEGSSSKVMPSQADSGVMSSPEVRTENVPSQTLSSAKTPEIKSELHLPTPLTFVPAGAKLFPSGPSLHPTSPRMDTCTNRLPQSTLTALLRTTPSRYTTASAVDDTVYTNLGKFTSKRVFHSAVLPSRLKLHMTPSPNSLTSYTGRTYRERSGLSTPSRYCGVQTSNSGYQAYPTFAEEVIRKKESLKAQLQFSSKLVQVHPRPNTILQWLALFPGNGLGM